VLSIKLLDGSAKDACGIIEEFIEYGYNDVVSLLFATKSNVLPVVVRQFRSIGVAREI